MSTTGTKCPIKRSTFKAAAKPITVTVAGQNGLTAEPREFGQEGDAKRSFGYYLTGKITVVIEGQPVKLQCGGCFTVIGSKEQAE